MRIRPVCCTRSARADARRQSVRGHTDLFRPVNFTYPSLINSRQASGKPVCLLVGPGHSCDSCFSLVIAVLLAKNFHAGQLRTHGRVFYRPRQDFLQFLNPVQAVREPFRFTEHLGKTACGSFTASCSFGLHLGPKHRTGSAVYPFTKNTPPSGRRWPTYRHPKNAWTMLRC